MLATAGALTAAAVLAFVFLQPQAPKPEITAVRATSLPSQPPSNIASKAATNGAPSSTSWSWGTSPITAAVTATYRSALAG